MVLFGSALLSRFVTSATPRRHRAHVRRITAEARLHRAITEALEPRVLLSATHLAFAVQPTDTTAGQGLGTVTVDLLDGGGNVDTGNSSLVTISIASGPDNADPLFFAVPANHGVVTISGLSLTVAGNYQLEASETGLAPATSDQFAINPDVATHLAITTPPATTAAGATMDAVTVAVEDQFNNVVTSDSSTITLGIATGPGSPGFSGSTHVPALNGVATFSNLSITKAGNYTFSVSDSGLAGDTSGSFTINPTTASQIVVTQGPSTTTAGLTLGTVTADIEDQYGNIVTGSNASVSIAVDTGSGTLAGTTTVDASSGVATFTGLSITKADAYTLSVSSDNVSSGDTGSFTINPDVATHLTITQGPTTTVAGQPISNIVVQVRDQYDNVVTTDASSVTLALATGSGTLSGTTTVTASSGIATFTGLSMTAAGGKTFNISDTGLTGATTNSTTITPAAADHLAFTTGPVGAPAGQTMAGVVVSVEDQFGNIITNDTSSITLSINTGAGTLNGTTTVAAINGVATFSMLSINQTGPFTIDAADGGLTAATSSGFTIGAALADHLTITQGPTTTVAGQTISTILVEVRDMFDNVVTTDNSNVTIALNTGAGTLSGTTTVAAVNGVATFSTLSMTTAGGKTLTVTDPGLAGGTTGSFTISPASASQIVLGQGPSATTAGVTLATQTVSIEDQFGNVETSDNATNIVASTAGGLNGTTTKTVTAGVATFSDLNITNAGNHTLHFADGGLTADTAQFTINADVATHLFIDVGPSSGAAGRLATLFISLRDQYGNAVNTDHSTITLGVASGPGTLLGTTQVPGNGGGTAVFDAVNLDQAGSYTLFVSDGALTGATTGSFTISAAAASQLVLTTQPTDTTAGQTISNVVAKVEDQYNNVVTTDTSAVTLALTTGTGTIAGTTTVNAVAGVATFNDLAMAVAGSKTFTLSDTGLTSATTSSFSITPAAADHLSFATAPSTGTVGALGNVVVDVDDQFGNLVTTDSSNVSVDINTGTGTLLGTHTANAVNGVATFAGMGIHASGQYTLAATDGSLTFATTGAFTLSPDVATQLVIGTPPVTDNAGNTIPSVVFVEDQYGNVVTSDNSQVTVSLGSGSATLNGTTTVTATNGVATFNGLFITKAGDYTFHFADGELNTVDSSTFTMRPIGPHHLTISTGPTTTVAGHTISTIVVDVLDVYGNISTSDTSGVTLSIGSGPGSLAGTTTQTAVAGVATFAGLDITATGSYTLSASDSNNFVGGDTSGSFNITPDSAAKVVFTTAPGSGAAGGLNTVVAKVEDQYGNVVTTDTSEVDLAIGSGSGSLLGTASANAVAGVATFSSLAIHTADSYTLTAADTGLTGATSGSFTISPAIASKLVITQQPTTTVAGLAISDIIATVEDQYGNVVTTDSSTVTLALATGTGTVSGTETANASSGIATFSGLSMTVAGNKTFTVTDSNDLAPATTNSVTISPDTANHLTITSGPTTGSAAALNTITVAVEDQYGNIVSTDNSTVGIAMNTGGGTLLGTTTAAASNGIATFNILAIHTPGTFTLSATDGSLTGDVTGSFTISPAAASQVVFTTQPGNISAGALGTVVAKVEDAFGNVVTTDSSTVSLSISGSGALLGTTTAQAANGVATFSAVTIHTAGTFTLGASDDSLTAGTSNSFTVSPTAATHLAFTSGPSSMVAGNLLTGITVSIEDQYNNVVTTSNANVTFNVTGGGSTFNFVIAAVNGVSTLNSIYLVKAGSYGVRATSGTLTGAGSNVITVTPDVPNQILITTGPATTVAGQTLSSVVVTVEDQFNNTETSDSSPVTLAINTGSGTLSGTTTINAINGIASFNDLVIAKTGAYTFSVADPDLTGATSGSFNITPAAASKLVITTQPTATVAGGTISSVVANVEDRFGNVVTTDTSGVSVGINTGTGTLAGTTTVNAIAGVATFSDLSMGAAGSKTFAVTENGLTSANTNSISIAPANANKVVFTTGPASGAAGALNTIIASVEDQYGNIVTTDTSEVDLAIGLGSGSLLGTASANAVAGVATFSTLAIHTPDTYTLTASDTGLTGDTSGSFNISPAAPTHLAITTQPTTTVAGQTISNIVVNVEDQFNNVVTNDTSSVAISITTGNGSLAGTTTVNAVAGVATFSTLSMGSAGSKNFTVSDTGLTGATTNSTIISPAAAAKLVILSGPTTTVAGQTVSNVLVAVEDQFGNVVTTDSSNVAVAIGSGPGSFAAGTTPITAVNGVATFGDLQINTAGGYTLSFSENDLAGTTSGSFSITPANASKVVFTTQPGSGTVGVLNTVVAKVEDQFNNVVTTNSSTVSLAIASGSGSLLGAASANAVAGVATFSSLAIHTADVYTLSASDTGLTGDTTGSFTLSPGIATQLVFSQQPGNAVAGTQLSTIKVSVEDQYNNVVTTDSSNINLTLNSGGNSVSLQVAASAGVATFSGIALLHTGTFTLRALDGGLAAGTSGSFTISPDVPSQLAFIASPTGGAAGALSTISVAIEDQYGNVVTTNSTATTSISVATGAGSVLGATVQQFSNGVATFSNLGITLPDTYTLDVVSNGVTAATSSSFTITPAAPSQLVIVTGPTTTVAGTSISGIVVNVEDQFGNIVTNNSSNVTIGIALGGGNLGGTTTVAAVNGVATFSNLSLTGAGSYKLNVADGLLTGATTGNFSITPAAATHIVVTQPGNTTAGQTISNVVVSFDDAFGNIVTSDNGSITIAIGSGPGTLGGTTTVNAVAGNATFNTLVIAKAGSYTLDLTSSGVTGTTTPSFTISADVATHLAFGTQPSGGAAGTLTSFTVDALDQYGNIATGDSSTVSLGDTGPGPLFGTHSANAVAGVATFNAAALHVAGNYTLTATDASLTQDTSGSFAISAAAPAMLVITTGPSNAVAGQPISTTATIEDQYGNVATSDNASVSISIATGSATLGGTTTVNAVGGIATFNALDIVKTGGYTLDVTSSGITAATSGSFTITPAAAAKLAVTQGPTDTVAGQTISTVNVAVEDAFGNVVTTDASTVTIALASGTANLFGNLTAIASSGVATFGGLDITKAGTYTFGVTDSNLTGDTSGSFRISPDAANHVLITGEPGDAIAGQPISSVTVAVEDQYGNVVTNATANVSITLTDDAVVLHGTTSVTPVNGVATFSDLSIDNAGTGYVLRTFGGGLTPDNSTTFNVTHDTASKLVITQGPSQTVAGESISDVIVQVEDAFGNLVTDDASSVSIALGTGIGTLSGTMTQTAVNGIATFSGLSLTKTGVFTLHATENGLTGDTSDGFSITPAAEAQLIVANATTAVAGATIAPITVTAVDQYGNIVTNLDGSATFSGSIPTFAGTSIEPYISGVATFSDLSITGAGVYSFTAVDHSLSSDGSNSITITPGTPAQLDLITEPSTAVAGQTIGNFVVHVEDQYGNVVTNDSSSVSIAIVTGSGTLSGTQTVTAINGVATFSTLSITTADDYTFDITDGVFDDSPTGVVTDDVTVNPAAPSKLVILSEPGTQAGRNLSEMTVAVEDQFGNIVTNNSSNVTISIATGVAALSGTLTEAAVNGIATFDDLAISKNGTYSLKAADAGLTTDTSDPFAIGAKLVFQKQPASLVAGQTIGPVFKVMIEDANGHVLTANTSTVTMSIASGTGTLLGTTSIDAVAGVATFSDLAIDESGSFKLMASNDGFNDATSVAFNVAPTAPTQMTILQDASSTVAGVKMGPAISVQLQDAFNNVAVNNHAIITATIASGPIGATIGGTVRATVTNGVATFSNLILTKAGTYRLQLAGAGLNAATISFNVTAAAAKKLAFIQQPTTAAVNANISPAVTVAVEDAFGNLIANSTASVTIAVQTGPAGSLTPVTVNAVNGIATFSTLHFSKKGTYRLKATGTALTLAASNALIITAALG